MPFCLVLLLTRAASCAQPEEACAQLAEDAEALRVLVQQCLQDGQLAPPEGMRKVLMERFEGKVEMLELQKQRRKLARQDAAAAELESRARANREKIMLGL